MNPAAVEVQPLYEEDDADSGESDEEIFSDNEDYSDAEEQVATVNQAEILTPASAVAASY
jgi:hypothetical protein